MWTPAPMRRVLLATLDRDLAVVTAAMGGYGAIHLLTVAELGDWAAALGWREAEALAATLSSYRRRIEALLQTLSVAPAVRGEERVTIAPQSLALQIERQIVQIETEVRMATERQKELQAERQRLRVLADELRLLMPLAGDLATLRQLTFLYFAPALVPAENLDRLRGSLARLPHVLLPVRRENSRILTFVFSTQEHAAALERALGSAYAERREIPRELTGSPREALREVQARQAALAAEGAALQERHAALARQYGDDLQIMYRQVTTNRLAADAWRRFGTTERTRLIAGWLPARVERDFVAHLSRAVAGRLAVHVENLEAAPATPETADPPAPTLLENPPFLRPFETLVNTYGIPNYRELDPTPLVGPLFVLMYGIMFGDVGQGAIIAIVGLTLVSGVVGKGHRSFGWVLFGCGLLSVVFGFLYGSVFLLEGVISPLWFQPLRRPEFFMEVSIIFGAAVLSTGLLLNIIDAVRLRDRPRLLLGEHALPGLWFYWGAIYVVLQYVVGSPPGLPVLVVLLGLPLLLIFLRAPLLALWRGSEAHRVLLQPVFYFEAAIGVFDAAVRFLSNTISFVRLAAFAISHAGMAVMVVTIAAMVRFLPLGGPLALLAGNIFVIALEGLVVFIQALRLNYYELFTKFFRGDGIPFQPFVLPGDAAERRT